MSRAYAVLVGIGTVPAVVLTPAFCSWLFAVRRPYVVVPAFAIVCGLWAAGWFPGELIAGYLVVLLLGASTHLVWGLLRISKRRAGALSGTVLPSAPGRFPAYTGGAGPRHPETVTAHHSATVDVQMHKQPFKRPAAAPSLSLRWMVHDLTENAERVGRAASVVPVRSTAQHRALALLAAACGELDAWAVDLDVDAAAESTRGGAR